MKLESVVPASIVKYNEPMSRHTSFRIGGPADILVMPENANDLMNSINWAKSEGISSFIMGAGSNLLVKDGGIRGLVIKLGSNFKQVDIIDTMIVAKSGVRLSELSKRAADAGLAGLEFAEGIPGTLGGAVYMNAGAYGGEIGDLVRQITCMNTAGELIRLNRSDLDFGYRRSSIQGRNLVILEVNLQLTLGDTVTIKSVMKQYAGQRKTKQPLEFPSAGSVFKRPEGTYVGPMVEQLGLKGYRIGDAEVSEKHAGFIINRGSASARDVLDLIKFVQAKVKEGFGIDLEPEILIVGED